MRKKHRGVISDAALDKATRIRHRDANTPRQKPVLTFTPEHGRVGGIETMWSPLLPPSSDVVELTPVHPPTAPHVDYDPQPESAEPTITIEREREDVSELDIHAAFPSMEERAQRAMVLDMPARRLQIWLVLALSVSET